MRERKAEVDVKLRVLCGGGYVCNQAGVTCDLRGGRRYVGRGRAQLRRLSVRVGGGIMGWMLP